jgi:hypothetical protein
MGSDTSAVHTAGMPNLLDTFLEAPPWDCTESQALVAAAVVAATVVTAAV